MSAGCGPATKQVYALEVHSELQEHNRTNENWRCFH